MRLLLDTHVWCWVTGERGLSTAQKRALAKPSPEEPLQISDISPWEITTLASLGRLAVSIPLRDWLEAASAPPLVQRQSISPAVATEGRPCRTTSTAIPPIASSSQPHACTTRPS